MRRDLQHSNFKQQITYVFHRERVEFGARKFCHEDHISGGVGRSLRYGLTTLPQRPPLGHLVLYSVTLSKNPQWKEEETWKRLTITPHGGQINAVKEWTKIELAVHINKNIEC